MGDTPGLGNKTKRLNTDTSATNTKSAHVPHNMLRRVKVMIASLQQRSIPQFCTQALVSACRSRRGGANQNLRSTQTIMMV